MQDDKTSHIIDDVRKIQIEILKEVHNVCCQHGLKYTLGYGTLIGAIRHKGYIPWDDDIDILMPRDDYNKLKKIWDTTSNSNKFILQVYENNEDYTNNFMKIRMNNTTFLQFDGEKEKKYHKGIFIDIFPGDRLPTNKYSKIIQYILFAVNLLCSRGYRSGKGGLYFVIESIILMFPQRVIRFLYKKTEQFMTIWNKKIDNQFVFPCTIEACKKSHNPKMFEKLILIDFEKEKFFITEMYDEVLREEYGDYMKLPDEKDRVWKHHPIMIDLNKNYEDL